MRLSKFLSFTILITAFSLLYVYQQSEIFRLAYLGQKRQVVFSELLEKNSILRYNIERTSSLVNIGSKISKEADFQMPDSFKLMRLASSSHALRPSTKLAKGESLLSRLFGIKAQAEAKTFNP